MLRIRIKHPWQLAQPKQQRWVLCRLGQRLQVQRRVGLLAGGAEGELGFGVER